MLLMKPQPTVYTYRIARKVRTGGSGAAAVILMLIGIGIFIFINWIIGLVFIIIGGLVDSKHKLIHHCDHCGNEVAATCRLCPTCHADLAPEPRKPFWIAMLRTLGLLAILASSLVLVWYVLRMR